MLMLLWYVVAYFIVTAIGVLHTAFNITVLHMKSMKESEGMGEGYEKMKPWHMLYNIAVFPVFAYIYFNGGKFGYSGSFNQWRKIVSNSYRRVRHIEAEPITHRFKMRLLALYLFLCYRKVHCNMVRFKVGRLANFFARISSLTSLLMRCLVFCLYNFLIGLGSQSFKENAQHSLNHRCKATVLIGTHSDTLCLYHPAQCTNTAL